MLNGKIIFLSRGFTSCSTANSAGEARTEEEEDAPSSTSPPSTSQFPASSSFLRMALDLKDGERRGEQDEDEDDDEDDDEQISPVHRAEQHVARAETEMLQRAAEAKLKFKVTAV